MAWLKNESLQTYNRIQRIDFGNGELTVWLAVYSSVGAFRRDEGPIGQFSMKWGRISQPEVPTVVDQHGGTIVDAQPAILSADAVLQADPELARAIDTMKKRLYDWSAKLPAMQNATVQ